MSSGRCDREMLPTSFMPRERVRSPQAANTITPARTRYLRQLTIRFERRLAGFDGGFGRRDVLLIALVFYDLVALRAQLQESTCFLVQALPFFSVEDGLLDDAEGSLGPEVVFVVEPVHRLQDLFTGQAGILDVRQL